MNRLHSALSPYLRQHAGQPVHWQEWGAEALAQAKAEDKPILLSIGYAACHWCHVMAAESFADGATAALMNRHFVNIKTDREERPDLDRIYQTAHQVFTRRSGGWPLTMFLTPAGEPFFGGTYFPPAARHGLPAFADILARVADLWQNRRADIREQNTHVLALLRGLDSYPAPDTGGDILRDTPLAAAAEQFAAMFDDEHGGIGGAPKFPHPVELAFCLHYAQDCNHPPLLGKVRHTLEKIASGGLRDHLSGGFFRYCTDNVWHIPHFEKMAGDNGLLLALYADAAAAFGDADFQQTAAATADWCLDTLRSADGGFYAALDADGGGGEGVYYLWDEQEIKQHLSAAEYAAFASHYGLAAAPRLDGKLHLVRRQTIAQTAAATTQSAEATAAHLASARAALLRVRGTRDTPAIDDKILASGSALICRGLARSGRLAANDAWIDAAQQTFDHLCAALRPEGRTHTARRGKQLTAGGFLDDCAFLLDAALELLRARFLPRTLEAATALADELCTHYEDRHSGGFFFAPHDGEALIRRLKTIDDAATPAGNGIAARALLILAQLTGDTRWQRAAEAALRAFYPTLAERPTASASLLAALQCHCHPPTFIYLAGDAAECRRWQQALEARADPARLVFCLPPDSSALPAALQKPAPASGALATLCDSRGCQPPLADLAAVQQQLEK